MIQERKILEALWQLKDNGPKDPLLGICYEVKTAVEGEIYAVLNPLFKSWPEYSGSISYPISGPVSPLYAFHYAEPEDMWNPEHPYGAARWRLVDYLIEELEKRA